MSDDSGVPDSPGWYPDPDPDLDQSGVERWWSGRGWTEHTRDGTRQAVVAASGPPLDKREAKAVIKAQQKAAQEAAVKEKGLEEARRAFAKTPMGQARAAFARGDEFFQTVIEISKLDGGSSTFGSSANWVRSGGRPDVLGQIEAEGYRLEHVGYVFIETGATSTNRLLTTGQGTVTRGLVQGVYLFRRTELVPDPT